jgi:hypothetical protein
MKKIYTLATFLFYLINGQSQSIFTNPITGTNPNTSNPYTTGQTVDPNLTVSGIGRGSGINGVNATNRYNADSWNTASIDLNAYFEFILTPNSGYKIRFVSFVYTGQASGTGPTAFAFRSSVDGYTADIGTPTVSGTTIDLSSSSYQNITTAITFRFYAWNASGAAGTFSINDFTFNGSVVNITLPVTFNSFSGYKDGSRNLLRWTTATETGNRGFDVQRSTDGIQYISIGFVNSLALNGNSSDQINYSFTDNNPTGSRQYYRLRQEDLGGQSKLSQVVLIKGNKPALVTVESIFPNPARDVVNLLLAAPARDRVTIIVTDITGRWVLQQVMNVETGTNNLLLDISRLQQGNYSVKVVSGGGDEASARFMKQ